MRKSVDLVAFFVFIVVVVVVVIAVGGSGGVFVVDLFLLLSLHGPVDILASSRAGKRPARALTCSSLGYIFHRCSRGNVVAISLATRTHLPSCSQADSLGTAAAGLAPIGRPRGAPVRPNSFSIGKLRPLVDKNTLGPK